MPFPPELVEVLERHLHFLTIYCSKTQFHFCYFIITFEVFFADDFPKLLFLVIIMRVAQIMNGSCSFGQNLYLQFDETEVNYFTIVLLY